MKKLLLISLSIIFIVSCNKDKNEEIEIDNQTVVCKEVIRVDSIGTRGEYWVVLEDGTGIVSDGNFGTLERYRQGNDVCESIIDFQAYDEVYQDRIND